MIYKILNKIKSNKINKRIKKKRYCSKIERLKIKNNIKYNIKKNNKLSYNNKNQKSKHKLTMKIKNYRNK